MASLLALLAVALCAGLAGTFAFLHFLAATSKILFFSLDAACTQHDIRLSNGPSAREGRIEYCYNNQWGTVCDDLFGTNDAKVVCNQLNYDGNGIMVHL